MPDVHPIPTNHRFKNITGQRFGKLVVVSYADSFKGLARWNCLCDCGGTALVDGHNLRRGMAQSCGCLQRERTRLPKSHGHCTKGRSAAYRTWCAMICRCENPNAVNFKNYGGRGITVCERWHVFENFLADMGGKPDGRTLDRTNNAGNYEKSNCRWATRKEQGVNKRSNRKLTFQGETLCSAEWATRFGFHRNLIHNRLRYGWSVERTLTTPARRKEKADPIKDQPL